MLCCHAKKEEQDSQSSNEAETGFWPLTLLAKSHWKSLAWSRSNKKVSACSELPIRKANGCYVTYIASNVWMPFQIFIKHWMFKQNQQYFLIWSQIIIIRSLRLQKDIAIKPCSKWKNNCVECSISHKFWEFCWFQPQGPQDMALCA